VDYFYFAAEHTSRGALWPGFAPARIGGFRWPESAWPTVSTLESSYSSTCYQFVSLVKPSRVHISSRCLDQP
jgi:hypothetical protein